MTQDPIAARHEAVIEKFRQLAQDDERIVAAWLQGSRADGSADDFSDIDLYLAVEDDAYPAFDPLTFAESAVPVLVHADLYGIGIVCLVEGPVKLDLLVEKASGVGVPQRPAARMLVDKAGVESQLTTGWEPNREDVARQVDQLLRGTFQGAMWPVRLLRRGQWMTHIYSELTLIHNMIVPLMLAIHDPRAFARNPMTRERHLIDSERAEVDALAMDVVAQLATRSYVDAYAAHLRIMDVMGRAGRAAADAFGIEYPVAAERHAAFFYEREWPKEQQ